MVNVAIDMAETLEFTDDAAVLDTAERVAEWIWDNFNQSSYRSLSPKKSASQGTARYSHLPDAEERRRIA